MLHQADKQIIMSSDKPPRDIAMLEDRLKSRFAGGMSIDMICEYLKPGAISNKS